MGKLSSEERVFRKNLSKAGWYTYVDEDTGRLVTNANKKELAEVSMLAQLPCEVVAVLSKTCVKIGPIKNAV